MTKDPSLIAFAKAGAALVSVVGLCGLSKFMYEIFAEGVEDKIARRHLARQEEGLKRAGSVNDQFQRQSPNVANG
jgi:hypothetical protein